MKNVLNILVTITLIGTSTTSLIACNTTSQYTKKELADLKEKNSINTKDGVLEWIAPQEKPFNEVDDKWYVVIWRGAENDDWKINKFKNNVKLNVAQTYNINENLRLFNGNFATDLKIDLQVILKNGVPLGWFFDRDNNFLKLVYRWNNNSEPNLIVDNDGNVKVNK